MATGQIIITTPYLTQQNLDDMATVEGWTGQKYSLDVEGQPIVDENGQTVFDPQTAQEFIANKYLEDSIEWARKACYAQQELQGKLNYDAETKTAQFRAITTATCELVKDE